MIGPVLALIIWSLIVLIWLYIRRIPAMLLLEIEPQTLADKRQLYKLPPEVRAVSDNYNHLMEQPTLFYALCLSIQLSGLTDQLFLVLAYIYVGLRVMHSLVQGFGNIVMLRFLVFVSATGVLVFMTFRTARFVFGF
jgi:hypothetical protein